ncbi:MAG: coproporphyrinogen III oxidase family protein [Coriobacteriales bacterium]|nr:coproporphyrinogen III oxidase family protein [Coriobacteriales bacterium]
MLTRQEGVILAERLQSKVMRTLNPRTLAMSPLSAGQNHLPRPKQPERGYMLYVHVPFCERLCPYCSFNRYPLNEARARAYFVALRDEMRMVAHLGYRFDSLYVGGGTPTILIDELATTIDLAQDLFAPREVSCETNPNHLYPRWLDALEGRVQRLSVGVQSFDDGLLAQMQRLDKYGSGIQIAQRLQAANGRFDSLNADMIFNFPSQTADILTRDLAYILESGVNQVTFYPLMASPAVERSLAATIGRVDYSREAEFYDLISTVLMDLAGFSLSSAWTFSAPSASQDAPIDEYIIDYEEYPAIGAGGFSYLDGALYVNTFGVDDYIRRINAGHMSVVGKRRFSKTDRMRYRLMMQLFGLHLDKRQWLRDFGVSVARGLPAEYGFFTLTKAFARNDGSTLTLTARGRYLLVALMREFFIGVNGLRDQARSALSEAERHLLFG